MPDVHVDLEPPVARAAALCSIHGSDRPFDSACGSTMVIASDAGAKKPMVVFSPHGVDVTFDIPKDASVAGITLNAGGVKVTGFTDVSGLSFHLAKEASALGGHAHLLAGDPVTLARVDPKSVIVRSSDDAFNIEELEAAASCDDLRFDGFKGNPTVPPAPSGTRGSAHGSVLHLKGGPGEAVLFTMKISGGLALTEVGTKGSDAHVSFATDKARFDTWIDQTELDAASVGFAKGRPGGCHMDAPPPHEAAFQVIDDTDVLVSDDPGKRGPSGVRLGKGMFVVAHEAHGGWAEISIEPRIVAPPPGLHFFVPWGALRDPVPRPPPPRGREVD